MVHAYDIEEDGTLFSGEGYPADTAHFNSTGSGMFYVVTFKQM